MLQSNHAMLLRYLLRVLAVVVLNLYEVKCERGHCVDHGYEPENGYRTPPAKPGYHYPEGYVISYQCPLPLVLNTSEYQQTCTTYDSYNYSWQPELFPSCLGIHVLDGCHPPKGDHYQPQQDYYEVGDSVTYVCPYGKDVMSYCTSNNIWSKDRCSEDISTDPMPYSPSDEVFCKLSQSELLNGRIKCCLGLRGTGNDSDDCCPRRGFVQFKCDSGYTLAGAASQWVCSDKGIWISLDDDAYKTQTVPPKCYSNNTRTEEVSVSDETLKQVFGVAAGVLVLLSAVIIFALCRPKLIDIKRRWRELRDDEDELIIDGRRITLPSYQEATTSRDMYVERNFDNARDFPTYEQRPRAISDNDLSAALHNSSTEHLINSEQNSGEGNGISSSQSLLLTAGTSIDAHVMINPPPSTLSDGSEILKRHDPPVQNDALWRTQSNELHSDCNLDSILPSSSRPAVARQPVLIDLERSLLNFPLAPSEGVLQSDSFNVVTNSDVKQEAFDVKSTEVEDCEPKLECLDEDDLRGPLPENSDPTHIKLTSPTVGSPTEESDSTVV